MQPEDRDAAYLWDMLDAAQTIATFVSDLRFGDGRWQTLGVRTQHGGLTVTAFRTRTTV